MFSWFNCFLFPVSYRRNGSLQGWILVLESLAISNLRANSNSGTTTSLRRKTNKWVCFWFLRVNGTWILLNSFIWVYLCQQEDWSRALDPSKNVRYTNKLVCQKSTILSRNTDDARTYHETDSPWPIWSVLQQTIRMCEMYQKHLMWSSRYWIKTKAF